MISSILDFFLLANAVVGAGDVPPQFRVGIEMPSQVPVTPAVENALRDMGIGYMNYYVSNAPEWEQPEAQTNEAMMALCERLGIDFSIACHHRNPAEATVRAAVDAGADRFGGVLIDELVHIRLLNPQFAPEHQDTMLADPATFTSLEQAYDETLAGYKRLFEHFTAFGAPRVTATHVWPDFLHMAARAGLTPCPKIGKEMYSPVSLAIGLGAALQYERDLWVDCDMWYFYLVPGHAVEEIWSNLLFAYWMGADLVYLEGSGYNLLPAGAQGTPFSLMNAISPDRYQLTPHGEMLKRFCREYLPNHPRTWTFRDVRPSIAVIRSEDGDHGQASWGVNKLYGSDNLKPDRDTAAWPALWNVLTHGKTGTDGLAWFKGSVPHPANDPRYHTAVTPSYATDPEAAAAHTFFVPLNGVVVFDHLVGYDRLKGVPLLFLVGKRVSDDAMAAIRRCVEEGAVCVAWGPLAAQHGFEWEGGVAVVPHGQGRFVLTDDFAAPEAKPHYEAFLGSPDEVRYTFGDKTVVFHRVTDNDVRVELR